MVIYVIGLGSMGKRRTRLLLEKKDVEVIGIDSRTDRCEEASKLYGIKTFSDINDACEYKKADCAFACTAPLSHASVIEMCLQNDLHVFTEINLVTDGYDSNCELAKKKNKVLFLSSTFLYRPEIKCLCEKVSNSNSAINYTYHVGQYLPDWHPWENYKDFFIGNKRTNGCREIFGIEMPWLVTCFGEIESVYAVKSKNTSLNINFNDNYIVTIVHKNGTKGVFIVDVVSRKPARHLEVFGEDLSMRWEGTPDSLFEYDIEKKTENKVNVGEYEHDNRYAAFVVENQYREEIDDFLETVKNPSHTPKWSFEKDKKVLSVIDEIEG